MLRYAEIDILGQTLEIGLDGNILRVCQTIFPHEAIVSRQYYEIDRGLTKPNEWCREQLGQAIFIDQFAAKGRILDRRGLWGAYGGRYFFFDQDQAFHFKMIFG